VGTSIIPGHEKEIEALSVSFGAAQQGLTFAGGIANAAKSQLSTITIQKQTDQTSPLLFIDCALGKPIPSAVITFRSVDPDKPLDYFVLTLTNAFISSYQVSAESGANGAAETIGLSFTTMKLTFQPVNTDGTLGTPISTTFNVVTNKQITTP
jgi:type VI secretion system secreted protein Hcp